MLTIKSKNSTSAAYAEQVHQPVFARRKAQCAHHTVRVLHKEPHVAPFLPESGHSAQWASDLQNLPYMSEAAINISGTELNVLPFFFPPLFFPKIGDIFTLLFFFISYTFRLCEEPQRISTCNRQFALQTKKADLGSVSLKTRSAMRCSEDRMRCYLLCLFEIEGGKKKCVNQ